MDRIHISNLEVFASHGVAEEERILGQKFLVDAVLFLDLEPAGQTDDLSRTVNYGEVCRFIDREMKKCDDLLLEKVCTRLAEAILLEYPLTRKVRLEIRKPWAPIKLPVEYASVRIERGWHRAFIGVGSNLGERDDHITFAREKLQALEGIRNFRSATVIETKPAGYITQRDFLNTVFEVETYYSPERLLDTLLDIEKEDGRTREIHWGPRTLDLDLLLYDDLVTDDPRLILPHPRMQEREFVLAPLCELNPWGLHPVYRKRFYELLAECKARGESEIIPEG